MATDGTPPAPARVATRVAARLHALDVAAQLGDLRVDPAAVELDLRLTGSARADALTAGDAATGLAGHRLTPATQARQEVLQLGQLDLRPALAALGVLGEDVEDQRGAVDDLDLDDVLERAALARGELAVADDGVGALLDDDVAQLERLALAEPGRGVGLLAALHDALEHRRPGRLGEGRELAHGVLGVVGGALGPDAGEHDALEAQLAVLDLGDVLELGRQALDASERGALLAVELVAVVEGVCRVVGLVGVLGQRVGAGGEEVTLALRSAGSVVGVLGVVARHVLPMVPLVQRHEPLVCAQGMHTHAERATASRAAAGGRYRDP